MTARDEEQSPHPPRTTPTAPEDDSERTRIVEQLWHRLDPQGEALDLKGLKKGLRRIDHPMKNADDMLRQIIRLVDVNGDGKIQYEEFRDFVEEAERELLMLFRSIDRDRDGRVNRAELQAAFQKTGLSVPARRLNGFFDELDADHDGYISFDEWRNFLLFIPAHDTDSKLATAFSYYASTVVLNAEGDSLVSDETLEGLGTAGSLLYALFGSLLKLAQPSSSVAAVSREKVEEAGRHVRDRDVSPSGKEGQEDKSSTKTVEPSQPSQPLLLQQAQQHTLSPASAPSPPPPPLPAAVVATTATASELIDVEDEVGIDIEDDDSCDGVHGDSKLRKTIHGSSTISKKKDSTLTQYIPHPGYFLAGALAGGISRTATAPFDRLKVYLLVNTRSPSSVSGGGGGGGSGSKANDALRDAGRRGQPMRFVRNATQPFTDAVSSLYRAGGLRTFFAGNGLNVVKIMPETAIKFGSYEAAKRACAALEGHGDPGHINPYSKFIAGGVAGMVAQFCVYPLDTLKFRLQCETVAGGPTGRALLLQTAQRMLWGGPGAPKHGAGAWRSAYRGVTMGLIGMFPYSAIDMGTFELLKGAFVRYRVRQTGLHEEDVAPGSVVTGVIGACSGAFGASVVYPLNVLRTRLQTQGTAMHPPTYTGIWDVASRTLANEGWRGLYKGLTPNLLKVAPALSITWIVYERSKKLLGLP